jgi:hypothetical protein
MVWPVQSDESGAKSSVKWTRWVIGIVVASLLGGVLCWVSTHDRALAIWGFAVPWLAATVCVLISLIWGLIAMPVMLLIARLMNGRKRE